MFHLRPLLALLVLLSLAFTMPTALAQGQAAPGGQLQVSDLPGEAVPSPGPALFQRFNVTLTLTNLVCPVAQAFPVALSAAADPVGDKSVRLALANSTLAFPVPAREYLSGPFKENQLGAIQVDGSHLPVGLRSVTVHITATYAGGNQGCLGSTGVPPLRDMKMFEARLDVQVPPGGIPDPKPAMPLPGLALLLAAVLAGLGLSRRLSGGSS